MVRRPLLFLLSTHYTTISTFLHAAYGSICSQLSNGFLDDVQYQHKIIYVYNDNDYNIKYNTTQELDHLVI